MVTLSTYQPDDHTNGAKIDDPGVDDPPASRSIERLAGRYRAAGDHETSHHQLHPDPLADPSGHRQWAALSTTDVASTSLAAFPRGCMAGGVAAVMAYPQHL